MEENKIEHYEEVLPLVAAIFQNESVEKQYSTLEPTKKLAVPMIVCKKVHDTLSALSVGDVLPESINVAGLFLATVPLDDMVASVKSQIGLELIIKFGIDELPSWSPTFEAADKKYNNKETTEAVSAS